MTRINTIDPVDLLDQHLLSEYKELPRGLKQARPLAPREVVPTYRMGTGHVLFFYPKGRYLLGRHLAVTMCLIARGYNLTTYAEPLTHKPGCGGDWSPGPADHAISLERLQERLDKQPAFYTLRGQPVSPGYYAALRPRYGVT